MSEEPDILTPEQREIRTALDKAREERAASEEAALLARNKLNELVGRIHQAAEPYKETPLQTAQRRHKEYVDEQMKVWDEQTKSGFFYHLGSVIIVALMFCCIVGAVGALAIGISRHDGASFVAVVIMLCFVGIAGILKKLWRW